MEESGLYKKLCEGIIATSEKIARYERAPIRDVLPGVYLLFCSDEEFISIYKNGNYEVFCTSDQASRIQERAKSLKVF
jgi:hypothetical protein